MALVTALWWMAGTSALLLVTFQWTRHQARLERKIHAATDHLYLAEGVIAREVSRLKARAWEHRWYAPSASAGLAGATIQGAFDQADYVGHVQDVADFWTDRAREPLERHTDIFLRITYPRNDPSATSLHFFARLVFRTPSPERPTPFHVRRLARVRDLDPLDARDRATLLARVNRDEREREWNRAESAVLARTVGALAQEGAPLARIARQLEPAPRQLAAGGFLARAEAGVSADERERERERTSGNVLEREARSRERQSLTAREIGTHLASAHVEAQVALERDMLGHLRRGQRALVDPRFVPAGGRGRHDEALDEFTRASRIALAQDEHNLPWSAPTALYAEARGAWALARTYRLADPRRQPLMDRAAALFQDVIDRYPWDPDRFPTRLEAPHASVPLAFLGVNRVNPKNVAQFEEAVGAGIDTVERWRRRYPGFHPWGEDAPTGSASPNPATPADEVAWYEIQKLPNPTLLLNFAGNTGSGDFALGTIQRWVPGASRWADHASITPRPGRISRGARLRPCFTATLGSSPGAVMGSQLLVPAAVPGSGPEVYDPIWNIWRRLRYDPLYFQAFEGPFAVLDDGRVMCVTLQTTLILDPRSETVREAARPSRERTSHRLVKLANGRVLMAGGGQWVSEYVRINEDDSGEVYDPVADRWIPVRNRMSDRRDAPSATVLDDGRVLFIGGWSSRAGPTRNWKCSGTAELYLPDLNVFWPGDSMPADVVLPPELALRQPIRLGAPRYAHWAVKLKDGKVLFGSGTNTRGMRYDSELFDPAPRTCSGAGATPCGGNTIGAERLPGGDVVIAGGLDEMGSTDNHVMSASTGRWDRRTHRWVTTAPLAFPQARGVMVRPEPD